MNSSITSLLQFIFKAIFWKSKTTFKFINNEFFKKKGTFLVDLTYKWTLS